MRCRCFSEMHLLNSRRLTSRWGRVIPHGRNGWRDTRLMPLFCLVPLWRKGRRVPSVCIATHSRGGGNFRRCHIWDGLPIRSENAESVSRLRIQVNPLRQQEGFCTQTVHFWTKFVFLEIATENHPFSHPDRVKTRTRHIKQKGRSYWDFQQKRP